MRNSALLAALIAGALAVPAAAQKLGARTTDPGQMARQMAPADPEAEVEQIAAAAAARPLGTLDNPVRVGGPAGARDYVSRLHCSDGSRPAIGPHSPGGIGVYGSVTELYPLDCGRAAPGRVTLAVDLYHEEHVETRAPAGMALDAH